MTGMTIGEVARKSGFRSSTIRYYEKIGLLPKAARASGQRRYDDQVLQRLAIVRFARHVGFSVAEIKQLLEGGQRRPPSERWRKMAMRKITQVDEIIAQANAVRKMLQETLDHKCPKLVERGCDLAPR
jgi:MerR family transcriptional regulator, redox-sensitive transcriptional activator SoxR